MNKQTIAVVGGAALIGAALFIGTTGGQEDVPASQGGFGSAGFGTGGTAPAPSETNITVEASEPQALSTTSEPSSSSSTTDTKKATRTGSSGGSSTYTERFKSTRQKDYGGGELQREVFNPASSTLKKNSRRIEGKKKTNTGEALREEGGLFDSGRFF